VVGAGEAGKLVVKELRANPALQLDPVAFVDDNPDKAGTWIQCLPVLGSSRQIAAVVTNYRIKHAVVAAPSAPLGRQLELADICRKAGVSAHSLPGMYQILAGYKSVNPLPSFDVHQLLRRNPVKTDHADITPSLQGKMVLVTGAGGSIGSELCHQVAACRPRAIVLLGHGENSIFEIELNLRLAYPRLLTHPVIVDVRNVRGVERVVKKYRPDVIFHAAAHKHVPFMESHVTEAIGNNIGGTQNMLRAAEAHRVARFVLISTDKAVNPSSIMGATKRMAELLVMAAARRSGHAYVAVRFGNVLGSRGSVLRVFQQQISRGGPLTITHPDMTRFFMTIPEAVQLVLQANVLGQGGEAFVLDMGQPVRIVDMAHDLLKLAGLEPARDVCITFTGIRPGEKLTEELFLATEDYHRTRFSKIFAAGQSGTMQIEALEHVVEELLALARNPAAADSPDFIQDVLTKICYYVDKYQPLPAAPIPPPAAGWLSLQASQPPRQGPVVHHPSPAGM